MAPNYLPRAAEDRLRLVLDTMPVAVLMGARQTGKSTLALRAEYAGSREYLSLDDFDVLARARENPSALVRTATLLTIDEVQRAPDLLLAVKRAVDEQQPRERGKFLLTGSANLLLSQQVSESLAGRAAYVTLWPMTRREQLGLGATGIWSTFLEHPVEAWGDLLTAQDPTPASWETLASAGGLPTPATDLDSPAERQVWFDGYVQTYLERDLQTLASIDNLVDFRRVMRAAFLRIGNVLNQTELARDTGVTRPTVHRYLNLLEASYQIVRIEPYAVNRTKRLIKSPKIYAADVGLALHVSGSTAPTGHHLENMVLADLLAWRDSGRPSAQVLFWRTVEGAEVDFVIEDGDTLIPIEVKTASRITPADARHIATFMGEYGDSVRGGLLLHGGDKIFWLADRILAAPWWSVV